MSVSPLRFDASIEPLRPVFDEIRDELGISVDFEQETLHEAASVAETGPHVQATADLREIPFVSIDPEGARDLDQALAIERSHSGAGYLVRYAIADVGAFVAPGGAVDREARRRGVTVYLPDRRAPLHPPVLSEDAASLLPGEDRQALVWRFDLDPLGMVRAHALERASVRNHRAYSYDEAQLSIDRGDAEPTLALLAELGPLREALEVDRGGVALDVPEQLVHTDGGVFRLSFRAPLPVERWNAQVSLMTGMVAADMMLRVGVGLLRTLPAAAEEDVAVLRRHARALDVVWPQDATYADVIRSLDAREPNHAALLAQASRLFRGAGYVAFDVAAGIPAPRDPVHAAVAAPYAHVTAPLRRLADRFANTVVLAVATGREPPSWVREALPSIPDAMADARRREGAADARAADVVEAAVLSGCVGAVLDAVVVRRHKRGVQVQIRDPAVIGNVVSDAALGEEIRVRVDQAEPAERRVVLTSVP